MIICHTLSKLVMLKSSNQSMMVGIGVFIFVLHCFTAKAALIRSQECISQENYCYRPDVCAYVFTFKTNDNGVCQDLEQSLSKVDDLEDDVDLLRLRTASAERDVETVRQELEGVRLVTHYQNNVINELHTRVEQKDNVPGDLMTAIRELIGEMRLQRAEVNERPVISGSDTTEANISRIDQIQEEISNLERQIAEKNTRLSNLRLELRSYKECDIDTNTQRYGFDLIDGIENTVESPRECCLSCLPILVARRGTSRSRAQAGFEMTRVDVR
ncbi:ERC protein 2-like [Ptychodera flava]|uniref:ERC protein 2-like n=1 Tax=Ptychodera flava TaxID=63121 RepID=UPI003969D10E